MNLDPLRNAATELNSLFPAGIWPDLGADGETGLLMPALAGIAAALTLALALTIYFQTEYRSYRDMMRHGLAAVVGLSLLAFAAYDVRNVAMAYLAKTSARPATEFELRWQKTTERARTLATEMARSLPEARQG